MNKKIFFVLSLAFLSLTGFQLAAGEIKESTLPKDNTTSKDNTAAAPKENGVPKTKCELTFEMNTWSVFYKSGQGQGHINCEDGQNTDVKIKAVGGGLSFGKTKLTNGKGTFSKVHEVNELYGAYAASEAHGGVVKSGTAQAMTKGDVSLALTATGRGFDFGIAFGKFKIDPAN